MKKQLPSLLKPLLCICFIVLTAQFAAAQTGYFGAYFIDTASAANSASDYTSINNASINSDSNAIFLETPNWLKYVYNPPQTAVWYNDINNTWNVYNENYDTIPAGLTINLVTPTTHGTAFQFTNPTSTGNQISQPINNAAINGNPGALIFITHNWGTGYNGISVYDTSAVGVWCNGGIWYLYNEKTYTVMAANMSFNVFVADTTGGAAFVQTTTASNIAADYTTIDNPLTNGNSSAVLIVTHSFSGGLYDTVPLGVYYNGSKWAIFHEDQSPMVPGQTYNVLVASAPVATGISNIPASQMGFKVSPNPASDNISINYTTAGNADVSIKLYATDGRDLGAVYQGKDASGSHTLSHNVSGLQPGSYYLVLSTGENRATCPVVIIR
jgi:hypothetical protein